MRGAIEMEKVNLSVNVQGEVCGDDVLMPTKLEDCAKLIPEEKLVKLCRSRIKQMIVSDLRRQAECKRIMQAYDAADDTSRRSMLSTALVSSLARKTLLRTIE
jgi:ribosomal protein S26